MVVQLHFVIKKGFSIGEKGVSNSVLRHSTRSISQGTEVTLVTEYISHNVYLWSMARFACLPSTPRYLCISGWRPGVNKGPCPHGTHGVNLLKQPEEHKKWDCTADACVSAICSIMARQTQKYVEGCASKNTQKGKRICVCDSLRLV